MSSENQRERRRLRERNKARRQGDAIRRREAADAQVPDEGVGFLCLPHCSLCGVEMDFEEDSDVCVDCFREELL